MDINHNKIIVQVTGNHLNSEKNVDKATKAVARTFYNTLKGTFDGYSFY